MCKCSGIDHSWQPFDWLFQGKLVMYSIQKIFLIFHKKEHSFSNAPFTCLVVGSLSWKHVQEFRYYFSGIHAVFRDFRAAKRKLRFMNWEEPVPSQSEKPFIEKFGIRSRQVLTCLGKDIWDDPKRMVTLCSLCPDVLRNLGDSSRNCRGREAANLISSFVVLHLGLSKRKQSPKETLWCFTGLLVCNEASKVCRRSWLPWFQPLDHVPFSKS